MLSVEFANKLQQIFDALVEQLTAMQRVLQEEHTALAHNQESRLTELTAEKFRLSNLIDTTERSRCELLQHHALAFDKQGLAALVGKIARSALVELLIRWDKIATLGQQCNRQNKINGIVVTHQQQRLQNTLRILRGQFEQSELYSIHGGKEPAHAKLSLGRI